MTYIEARRKEYLTFLSVISSVAVVFLHANECFWTFSNSRYWITSNFIECFFYYAVPIFFMISGATLLDYPDRYTHKEYFLKRVKKVVIPYCAWSIIVVIYKVIRNRITLTQLSIPFLINGIMTNSLLGYYWFFSDLFIAYLCIPVFASIKNKKSIFIYMSIVGLTINSFIPFVNSCFGLKIKLCLEFPLALRYLIFLLIGYLLNNIDYSKYNIYIYIY